MVEYSIQLRAAQHTHWGYYPYYNRHLEEQEGEPAVYIERSIDIAAPPDVVWEVFSDVERWHEWTASIKSVTRLDEGPFGVGSRARVLQPLIQPAVFEVTEFNLGRNFTWRTKNGGISAVANHLVEGAPVGTRVTISLEYSGAPLILFALWIRWLTNRYFKMETAGLKKRSEQRAGVRPGEGAPRFETGF